MRRSRSPSIHGIGLACRKGQGRGIPIELAGVGSARCSKTSHAPRSCTISRTRWRSLQGLGIEGTGFRHDVMLYAFLLAPIRRVRLRGAGGEVSRPQARVHAGRSGGLRAGAIYQKLRRTVTSADSGRSTTRSICRWSACCLGWSSTGIRVDPAQLGVMSERIDAEMQTARRRRSTRLAGTPFNINSPQQLAKVLYEDLNLPAPMKYGQGKSMSTAADILEELAAEHQIARLVLEYRQLAKLKGTYVDALPALIRPDTGRIHTTFNQAGAATGRFSSSNPNLQNIPIRTELGREIRAAFVPARRDGSWWSPTTRRSSCVCSRICLGRPGADERVPPWRRHPHADRGRGVRRPASDGHAGHAAQCEGRELRHRLRADAIRSRARRSASTGKEAERYIYAYFERYGGVRKWIDATIAESAAVRRLAHAVRTRAAHSRHARAQSRMLAGSPSEPPSTRRCRARRPT